MCRSDFVFNALFVVFPFRNWVHIKNKIFICKNLISKTWGFLHVSQNWLLFTIDCLQILYDWVFLIKIFLGKSSRHTTRNIFGSTAYKKKKLNILAYFRLFSEQKATVYWCLVRILLFFVGQKLKSHQFSVLKK